MNRSWTKLTATGHVKDLEQITAVMSMLDNGLMIEDYSDFSLNGMYGELVDETILEADRDTVKVSLFVPEEKHMSEYTSFLTERFTALGISVQELSDGLLVTGGSFSGGTVDGANDHRIVMAAASAATRASAPVTILGAEAVRKSYPDFFTEFSRLGGAADVL